jgi:methylation protein EvaC
LDKDPFVVEIGSNDGVLLSPLKEIWVRALGFEPSKNVSKIAMSKGLNVVNDYFTEKIASEIANRKGKMCPYMGKGNFGIV